MYELGASCPENASNELEKMEYFSSWSSAYACQNGIKFLKI